ncbi:MAG: ATP-binding protein [Dehalococcoidia bacterium]
MAEPHEQPEPYVFLSYTSPDRVQTFALADRLAAAGIPAWVDRRNLVGGSSWDAAIVEAIRRCSVFAVLCSAAAMDSPNVLQEVRLAQQNRKPVLPLLLEEVSYPPALDYALAGRQWVELLERSKEAWLPDVLRALAGLGLVPSTPTAAPAHPLEVAASPPPEPAVVHLPTPRTSFLGRAQELAEVSALLATSGLLTLTGPGGTGKTRLALAAARQVADRFADGVWFVDLSGIVDPAGVLPAIAQVLDVRESEGRSLALSLAASLRRKQLLLVLDNFEQVIAAAMAIYDLLAEAPGLSLLVTSRVLLRVAGEQEYAVPPLPLPEEIAAVDPALLRQNPAVQLFLDRARALRPELALSLPEETTRAIGAICRRLDGLPLAIELAAARVKLLPPVQLLARLERRLPLLTGGVRSLPARQQTLRATIAWSWDLLTEPERVLFRRLGVFAGGWSLEAAEQVCTLDGDLDVLEGLAALVDQSLVRQQDDPSGAPRFWMLATLQEFALEQLDASGEATDLRHGHAAYYCTLAEAAYTAFWQRGRYVAVQALIPERDNLLAALQWLLDAGELEIGLRLAAALQMYWYLREPAEGLRWTETFLAQASGDVPPELRGAGHWAASSAAAAVGEFGVTLDHAEQASVLLRGTTAQAERAICLSMAALHRMPSDALRARLELEEARGIAEAMGAEHFVGFVAFLAAGALMLAQLPAEALPFAEEALRIGRRLDAEWLTGVCLQALGRLAQLRGDRKAARDYAAQALPLQQRMQNRWEVGLSLALLASCEAADGEAGALRTWQASLAVSVDLGTRAGMVTAVLGIAALLAARGEAAAAARLLGAVEAGVEEVYASQLRFWAQPAREQALPLARAALSAEAFAQAWVEGQALTLDEAADLALAAASETVASA